MNTKQAYLLLTLPIAMPLVAAYSLYEKLCGALRDWVLDMVRECRGVAKVWREERALTEYLPPKPTMQEEPGKYVICVNPDGIMRYVHEDNLAAAAGLRYVRLMNPDRPDPTAYQNQRTGKQ